MLAARLLQSAVVKARSARSDSGRLAAAQTWLLQAHLSAPTLLTMASQLSARAALAVTLSAEVVKNSADKRVIGQLPIDVGAALSTGRGFSCKK